MFAAKHYEAMKEIVGLWGEDIACAYLEKNGYRILGRNVRPAISFEIDIISRDSEGVIVFVEVKAGTSSDPEFRPELHFNRRKFIKIRDACLMFAGKHPKWFKGDSGWRIDLITVRAKENILTDNYKDCVINHYKNVVAEA